jgi:uncharacterized protein with GYD domain
MPAYLFLMNATPEGLRKVAEIGDRYESFKKEVKKAGGSLIGAYALLGGHDYAAVAELPSEKEALRLSLGIGRRGGSTVQTYRAIPMDEFSKIAKSL